VRARRGLLRRFSLLPYAIDFSMRNLWMRYFSGTEEERARMPMQPSRSRTGREQPDQDQANRDLMRRAIALATENVMSGKGGPFGALVVRNGTILGEGTNTVTAINDPTAHAEINAIRAAAKALKNFTLAGCQIYTSCEPCPMCLAAA